ncbi:G-type lectin S-receptor-like serine/threonine-protein kinase LECRK3, partial [Tanacetum coccineum]
LVIDQAQGQQINIFDTGGASFASMQDSGNFVLYNFDGTTVLWQSFDYPTDTLLAGQRLVGIADQMLLSSITEVSQSIGVFKLKMQVDGNLVQYPNVGTGDVASSSYLSFGTAWAGPNVTLNLDFDELWSMGCQRNYTVEKCEMNDLGNAVRMTSLSNARWEEATFEIPEAPTTQEQYSFACLNDCNCEAALFCGQECRLQRPPLRFMEVTDNESNVGLIKVYVASLNNGLDPSNPLIEIKKARRMGILVTGVSLISVSFLILLFSGVLIHKARVWAYRKVSDNINFQLFENVGPRAFSYAELERLTDGFKEEFGRGSFGIIYKGVIETSMKAIPVKKLKEELA